MAYGEVTERDIDNAVSRASRDLEYEMQRGDQENERSISRLDSRLETVVSENIQRFDELWEEVRGLKAMIEEVRKNHVK